MTKEFVLKAIKEIQAKRGTVKISEIQVSNLSSKEINLVIHQLLVEEVVFNVREGYVQLTVSEELENQKTFKPIATWTEIPAHGKVAMYETTGDLDVAEIKEIVEKIRSSGKWSISQNGYGYWIGRDGKLARRKY